MRNDQELFVTETNLSKGVIREAGCFPLDFPPAIGIAVIHDGIPMQMDERRWAAKYYRAAKKGPALCDEISWEQKAQPGGAIGNPLDLSNFYDLSKPGKYEVTLTKEPFSSDSPINVAVRSNTVTINVPEPKAQKLNY